MIIDIVVVLVLIVALIFGYQRGVIQPLLAEIFFFGTLLAVFRFHDQYTSEMSKLLHLGLPLGDVVAASTSRAAAQIAHVAPGLGTLAIGAPADVSVLELQHGSFPLEDGEHVVEQAERRLVARHVLRDGVHVRCDEPVG